MVYPIDGGAAVAYQKTPPIDQDRVDLALQNIRADIPLNRSQLAAALQNPNLNQAEKDLIIQTLARDQGSGAQLPFYANDALRASTGDYAALTEDQRVIAEGVQGAYERGAINA